MEGFVHGQPVERCVRPIITDPLERNPRPDGTALPDALPGRCDGGEPTGIMCGPSMKGGWAGAG